MLRGASLVGWALGRSGGVNVETRPASDPRRGPSWTGGSLPCRGREGNSLVFKPGSPAHLTLTVSSTRLSLAGAGSWWTLCDLPRDILGSVVRAQRVVPGATFPEKFQGARLGPSCLGMWPFSLPTSPTGRVCQRDVVAFSASHPLVAGLRGPMQGLCPAKGLLCPWACSVPSAAWYQGRRLELGVVLWWHVQPDTQCLHYLLPCDGVPQSSHQRGIKRDRSQRAL